MNKIILGFVLSLTALSVYANCTSSTITLPNGKMMFCTTCCYNGNCNTTCF